MSNRLTKKQLNQKRKKSAYNRIRKKELQDKKGISRHHFKYTMSPKIYTILKIISIVSIPVAYILWSPLLIFCMIFSASLIVFSRMTEKEINKSFIKENHIKLPKIDSYIAILVLIITVFGTINNLNRKKKMTNDSFSYFVMTVKNTSSLLTGGRNIFQKSLSSFGTKELPDNLPSRGIWLHHLKKYPWIMFL